jgi:hypothetical protein
MTADRRFWIAYGCLVGVGLFLGLRTQGAVGSILSSGSMSSPLARRAAEADRALLDQLTRKDQALAASPETVRDPFRAVTGAWAGGGSGRHGAEGGAAPVVRALLYDNQRPVVQLQSGRTTSGWLGVGDVYRGWTVDEINQHSVRLSHYGSSIVLASS